MSARILYVTPEQYHADPCESPSLSSSIARVIVDQSPEHALELHPRREELGWVPSPGLAPEDEEEESSEALDSGHLIHALVLGKGLEEVCVVEADNWRTKAAREARDAARSEGLTPVTRPAYERAERVAGVLRGRIAALGYPIEQAAQRTEVAIAWHDEGVLCRGMVDYLDLDRGLVLDLKTTSRSAHPEACRRSVVSYGYDIQHAAYTRAVAALQPELVGRVELVFLFAELNPPYSVTPARLSGAMRELGEMRWARARRIWAGCVRSHLWPGYADAGPILLEPKPWDLEAEMIAAADGAGVADGGP